MIQDTLTDSVHKEVDTVNFLGTRIESEFQQLQINDNTTESWIFVIIVGLLAILAFGLFFHKTKFSLLLKSSVVQRHSNQLVRESNPLSERISLILLLVYLFAFSLYIYYLIKYFTDITELISGMTLYAMILGFIFLSWFFKTLIIRITGNVFYTRKQAYLHIVSNFLLNISAGLIYLILIIPMVYSQPLIMMYTGLALIVSTFIFKVYKGFQIGLNFSKFSKFHLFLYLCTLEILPVVIMVKFCLTFL